MTLPVSLAKLGLIDEYEFVVQPRLAGHGPTLFAGLSQHVDLKFVDRREFASGAVAMRARVARTRRYRRGASTAALETTHRKPVFTSSAAGVSKRSRPRSDVVASESIVSNAPPRLTR